MIEILVSHNESELLFNRSSERITFEGSLDDIAEGLFEKYGKTWAEHEAHDLIYHVCGSRIGIECLPGGYQHLVFKREYYFGDTIPEKPIFLDLLNEKYIKIVDRYISMKGFW